MSDQKSVFNILNSISVNDKTEKKDNLTYLSWAWAWTEVKKHYPNARYEVLKFNNIPYVFDPVTGYMVYTTVTIDDITHEMWLPVMNGANKAMLDREYTYNVAGWKNGVKTTVTKTVEAATMTDINKTIMRCLTKNLAMHGLGLYIYAGEDLPEVEPVDPPANDKVDKIDRPAPTTLKNKVVNKVPMPPPASATAPEEKPFEEPKGQEQEQPETKPETPTAPQQPVKPAAQVKQPLVVQEIVIGSANWAKVLNYIAANKALGFDAIITALSTKYTMGPGIKKQLKIEIEK